jgi:thioredoxin-like negative regulator of GroEL
MCLESQLKKNKRILALFYASWCSSCRSFLAVFDENTANRNLDLALRVILDDYDNQLWEEYSIETVPTVILFNNGKVYWRLDGRFGQGLSEKQLKEWLERI